MILPVENDRKQFTVSVLCLGVHFHLLVTWEALTIPHLSSPAASWDDRGFAGGNASLGRLSLELHRSQQATYNLTRDRGLSGKGGIQPQRSDFTRMTQQVGVEMRMAFGASYFQEHNHSHSQHLLWARHGASDCMHCLIKRAAQC